MTREEHAEIVREIIENADNPGTVAEKLAVLVDDYGEQQQAIETAAAEKALLESQKNQLETQAESLRKSNMSLLLQIGTKPKDADPPAETPPEKTADFDSLFNEKGELK